jgi:molecular chaperone GrpE
MTDEKVEDFEFEETTAEGSELSLKDKLKDLKNKLKEKTEEAKQNLDGWQRSRAELVNKDRMIQSERAEIYKQAAANILEELIPVLDNYDHARRNKEAWEKVEVNWRTGVEYIFQQLIGITESEGLKKIEPKIGDKFHVGEMHAIEELSVDDESKDHTVAEVVQAGYELNGRLLRESKVKIYIKK